MWKDLNMRQRASLIKEGVANHLYKIDDIANLYNTYAQGGPVDTWTMVDENNYNKWRNSLPTNLRNTDNNIYDMRAAFKAGKQPEWNPEDNAYHLSSRNPKSGIILKAAHHDTFIRALAEDANMGYYPTTDNKGRTYTSTWKGNENLPFNTFARGGSTDTPWDKETENAFLTSDNPDSVFEATKAKAAAKGRTYEELQASMRRPTKNIRSSTNGSLAGKQNTPSLRRAAQLMQKASEPVIDKSFAQGYEQALEEQQAAKDEKLRQAKLVARSALTAGELTLSGGTLLGAYANWKKWATSSNAVKQGIANWLTLKQFPLQVGSSVIDGIQLIDNIHNGEAAEGIWNGVSLGLGISGALGAKDILRPTSQLGDRILDGAGVVQAAGDWIKFGVQKALDNKEK